MLAIAAVLLVPAAAQAADVHSQAACVLVDDQPTLKLNAQFRGFATQEVHGTILVDGVQRFNDAVPVTWGTGSDADNGTWEWAYPAVAGQAYRVDTEWTWPTETRGSGEKHLNVVCPAPGIELTKTGPVSATAGETVTYSFAVSNKGNVTLALGAIADDKCAATPVRLAGEADASFDPGDTFDFTCTYVVPAGVASVVNTASVCGSYTPPSGPPMEVCDEDAHEFPVPATTPPAGAVLPGTVASARARLSAPSGCVKQAFSARVRGLGIASVAFYVDGRRVKRLAGERRVYWAKVKPRGLGFGRHRVMALVRFDAASGARPQTLRMTFRRCARQTVRPRFTG